MIDLHAHTDRSDGLLSPRRLVDLARNNGLTALGVTDHDTLEGYDDAAPYARELGVDLICGVELASTFRGRTVHLLGYFLDGPADERFRARLSGLKQARRDRNRRLAARLRELGLDIALEEAESLGRDQTGRPHFARLLVKKGYVSSYREAFDRYLDESAPGYVARDEAPLDEVFSWIRDSGGLPTWAHPGRFIQDEAADPEALFREIAEHGCLAVECYHRDHNIDQAERYAAAARRAGLGVTGGSDFHGPAANGVDLGGLLLPDSLLAELREYARAALGVRETMTATRLFEPPGLSRRAGTEPVGPGMLAVAASAPPPPFPARRSGAGTPARRPRPGGSHR